MPAHTEASAKPMKSKTDNTTKLKIKNTFGACKEAVDYLQKRGWKKLGQSRLIFHNLLLVGQRREIRRTGSVWSVKAYG
jgi:hypothetical protein